MKCFLIENEFCLKIKIFTKSYEMRTKCQPNRHHLWTHSSRESIKSVFSGFITKTKDRQKANQLDKRLKGLKLLAEKTEIDLKSLSVQKVFKKIFKIKKTIKIVDNLTIITDHSDQDVFITIKSNKTITEDMNRVMPSTNKLQSILKTTESVVNTSHKEGIPLITPSDVNSFEERVDPNSGSKQDNLGKTCRNRENPVLITKLVFESLDEQLIMKTEHRIRLKKRKTNENTDNFDTDSMPILMSQLNPLVTSRPTPKSPPIRIPLMPNPTSNPILNDIQRLESNELKQMNFQMRKKMKNFNEYYELDLNFLNLKQNGKPLVNPHIKLLGEEVLLIQRLLNPKTPSLSTEMVSDIELFKQFCVDLKEEIRHLEKELNADKNRVKQLKRLVSETPKRHERLLHESKVKKYCPFGDCLKEVTNSWFMIDMNRFRAKGDKTRKGKQFFCSKECLDAFNNSIIRKRTVALPAIEEIQTYVSFEDSFDSLDVALNKTIDSRSDPFSLSLSEGIPLEE